MAIIDVTEADFQALSVAACDAQEAGEQRRAEALACLALRVDAALRPEVGISAASGSPQGNDFGRDRRFLRGG
jgi:hypothetical protein